MVIIILLLSREGKNTIESRYYTGRFKKKNQIFPPGYLLLYTFLIVVQMVMLQLYVEIVAKVH